MSQQVNERRQRIALPKTPFRNMSSYTMPAYGVGLVTQFDTDGGTDLVMATVYNNTFSNVIGYLVNGPRDVASGHRGDGYFNVGPVPCLYDTADGTPSPGDQWGVKYTVTDFKLRKGYGGFTATSYSTGGSSSTSRSMFVPEFLLPERIVAGMRRSSYTITNADSATQIIAFNTASFGTNGEWPSAGLGNCIDLDTSTGRATVKRAGLWKVDAAWSSEGSARFASPYQSKVHRANISLYKNASRSGVSGGQSDWYHFSLANADTTPTAGVAIRVNGSLSTQLVCAVDDILDLRVTVSEVTADSGTTTEGHILFAQCEVRFEYVGPQLWLNDY